METEAPPPNTDNCGGTPTMIYVHATTVQTVFRDDAPRYKCCCYKYHVGPACKWIAIFDWVSNALLVIACIVALALGRISVGGFFGLIISCAIAVGAAIFLWFAVPKSNPNFVLPYILVKILQIVAIAVWTVIIFIGFLIGMAVLTAFLTAKNTDQTSTSVSVETTGEGGDEEEGGVWLTAGLSILMAMCALGLVADIWFLVVAIKCRRYLAEKNFYCSGQGIQYQTDPLVRQQPTGDAPPAYTKTAI